MAKRPIKPLKAKLWKLFSLYIKLKFSKDGQRTQCYTCDAYLKIGSKNCQLGHWLPKGTYQNHYFNEDNVRPQCGRCNNWGLGEAETFRRRLQAEIGESKIDWLYETRKDGGTRKPEWYDERIEHYKEELKILKSRFNLEY
jgi:hypothetical protein|tara:strand:+ start:1014 stop:1436 length:423 start_codon:yes stop_codon:yes gene_type:complete